MIKITELWNDKADETYCYHWALKSYNALTFRSINYILVVLVESEIWRQKSVFNVGWGVW